MKEPVRSLMFLTFAALFFFWFGYAYSTPLGDETRRIKNSLILVHTSCLYEMGRRSNWGVGFFAANKKYPHLAVTARHNVACLGDGAEGTPEISVVYRGKPYSARKLGDDVANIDTALLDVALPKNAAHERISILPIENLYDDLSPVLVAGYFLYLFKTGLNISYPSLEATNIISVLEQDILISLFACEGMSGSPVLFWWRNQYYAIGIIRTGLFADKDSSCSTAKISWATRLTNIVFEAILKTAP